MQFLSRTQANAQVCGKCAAAKLLNRPCRQKSPSIDSILLVEIFEYQLQIFGVKLAVVEYTRGMVAKRLSVLCHHAPCTWQGYSL